MIYESVKGKFKALLTLEEEEKSDDVNQIWKRMKEVRRVGGRTPSQCNGRDMMMMMIDVLQTLLYTQ